MTGNGERSRLGRADPGGTSPILGAWHPHLEAELLERGLAAGLGPWLYHGLASGGRLAEVDPPLGARLRQSYLATTGNNLLILRELGELLAELPGIRVVLLKGLALLPLYPRIGLRPLSDADVLIDRSDLPEVRERLLSLGYRAEPVHSEAYDAEFYRELAFSCPTENGLFRLDLHWGLASAEWLSDAGMPGFQEIWVRARAGPLGEKGPRIPSPEHTLLHLCIHLALHHSFEELLPYLDMAILLGGVGAPAPASNGMGPPDSPPVAWELFLPLAIRSGWRPAIYCALARARTLAGARVPEEPLRELKPAGWRLGLIERLAREEQPVGHQAGRLLQLALADRVGSAAAMVGRALYPPESWLRLRYPASGRSIPVLRVLHALRLTGLLGRGLRQLRGVGRSYPARRLGR